MHSRRRARWDWLFSLPVQILLGLVVVVLLPGLARWDVKLMQELTPGQQPSVIGTSLAFVAGLILMRRFGRFPGVQGVSYILPSFAITYGVLVLTMFFMRIDFARSMILASFGTALIWCFLVWYLQSFRQPMRLAIVPFGSYLELLSSHPNMAMELLEKPSLQDLRADAVIADLRADYPEEWERFLANCALAGVPVYHMKQMAESLTGRVRIEHLSENTLGALLPSPEYVALKRVLEIGGILLFMPILFPVMSVLAILIRIDSPGSPIFLQRRAGYRGQHFTMFKFRTMRTDMEGPSYTQASDPRITRIGRVLRKCRMDELPQIINVLLGHMSLIGPRPESVELSEWYEREIPHYRYRHIVRPGITGWAQVQQGFAAEVEDVTDKLHYDFYYIKHFSLWLDMLIVLRTVHVVFTGNGSR